MSERLPDEMMARLRDAILAGEPSMAVHGALEDIVDEAIERGKDSVRLMDIADDTRDRAEKAEQQIKVLREALASLVEALNRVRDDSRYQAVWISFANHGGLYEGPFYKDELASARQALEATKED